jgi:hypothetical protein
MRLGWAGAVGVDQVTGILNKNRNKLAALVSAME